MAWGKKLLLSLSVFAIRQRKRLPDGSKVKRQFKFKFKLSFIVIPLHVGTYSGTKCRASRVHGAT